MQGARLLDFQDRLRGEVFEFQDQLAFRFGERMHPRSIACVPKRTSSVREPSDKGTVKMLESAIPGGYRW